MDELSTGWYTTFPMRILLATPPMIQLNTPYPATAYLTGFLRQQGIDAVQADPAIMLVTRLFSNEGLERVKGEVEKLSPARRRKLPAVKLFLEHFDQYAGSVDRVIAFLQGRDPTLAMRIVTREFLPEGSRFKPVHDTDAQGEDGLALAFGSLGIADRAKYLASLYIDDLADVVREGVDAKFELSRYGEKISAFAPTFDPILEALEHSDTLIDQMLSEITQELIEKLQPDVVGLTAPFPGNVYGAFRMARTIKRFNSRIKIALGGGFPNTELRELQELRVFDDIDFVILDDGERPLLRLLDFLAGRCGAERLVRTFVRERGKVVFRNDLKAHDIPHKDAGTPTYDGLPLGQYLSVVEMLNPMHRLWSDGRWNKLTLAHGCYWRGCNFCDINLDYIQRYDAAGADLIVDRIEALIKETGQTGFHFVDEAAPPAVLFAMAKRLIERNVAITWWGNIRFEKSFTPHMTDLLAKSGCVAVSGGLEVASDRLLKLMNKGVTVEQVARVTHAFTQSGILVHAYLMYGFPTQTEQETIDSLERVRQLFAEGCIQSAYWHRFAATVHSPIGREPKKFGIELHPPKIVTFARNEVPFTDPVGVDHDLLGVGLRKALYNYMHGVGLDTDVRFWFDHKVPKAKVPARLIASALAGKKLSGVSTPAL